MTATSQILGPSVSRAEGVWVAAVASPWVTIITAGGMDDIDSLGTVRNPDTDITETTRVKFKLDNLNATTLRIRMGYFGTPDVSPVIVLWGRTLPAGQTTGGWKRLYNKASTPATDVTLTADGSNDATDDTYKYTTDNPLTHAWDVDGCNEFIVQVKTAFTTSAGSAALAFLQVQRA